LVLAGLSYGTRMRNQDYRSDLTLWAPDDLPLAFTMLSNLAMYNGRYAEAERVFGTLLEATNAAQPDDPLLLVRGPAINGLGALRALENRLDDAQDLFARALEQDALYTTAENNLGVVLFKRGDRSAAQVHLQRALQRDPRYNYLVLPAGELVPLIRDYPGDARRALASSGLNRVEMEIKLNPPVEEFAMDFTLGLIAGLEPQ